MEKTNSDYVYIDARHLGKAFLEKRFPTIYAKCLENGYHMEKDVVPVAPVEHFGIGGIQVDLDGKTTIKNLFANGECASSGVHGANRLASNSLLECVVFGKKIANFINQLPKCTVHTFEVATINTKYERDFHQIRTKIRKVMSEDVFIARTTQGLENAKHIMDAYYQELAQNATLTVDYYRTLNTVTVAKLIIEAAISRKESLGSHLMVC